jgi:hypothetical protein
MSLPTPRRALGLTALCTLTLAGCVDFDREVVVITTPPDSKELRALIIYEGIHGKGNSAADLTEAKQQLGQFVDRGQEFCLIDNWITHVVLTPSENDDPQGAATKTLLRGELTVRNHAFYLEGGKLCGYQTVTARDRDRLVAGLNKIGSAVAAEGVKKEREKPRENPSDLSEESLRRLEKAAQSGFAWLELQPGQLRFTLPITAADAKRLKNEFAASNDEFTKALLKENSVTIGADDAGFHVTLGEGGGKPIRYTVPHPPSFPSFRKEITEYARTLKVPFKDGLTTEKVIAEFLKGGR